MSDDEADPELLELLRQRLGMSSGPQDGVPRQTGVLKDAEFIYHNAIDVHVDMYGTKGAASDIYRAMKARGYSTETWSTHVLHPKPSEGFSEVDIVNFVFTMDLLNFSFWSERSSEDRFQVEYRGQRWTGYNSLVACLRRALDEGIPITTPRFWTSPRCTEETLARTFRSATTEPIPLLSERVAILKEASTVLRQVMHVAHANGHRLPVSPPDHTVIRLIEEGGRSAGKLVNLLAKHFKCFQDESRFDGRKVRLLKRAQIFVADLWAAFNGTGYGEFDDIDHLTMFADYRVPQSLHSLGVLTYSPPLEHLVRDLRILELGDPREVQLRGCSIWAVELIRREILRNHPEATSVNAVLIDFFLYDLAKEKEAQGLPAIPHHRTRSIWY
ncbi:hypothetical protein CERZMDRAFT_32855 [Cercospora zeae-maydis SCOH1-5]|uniref:Queuosine 5'-phosphate N-glycosylase/hydrolase n=1 Tax=Cercospora zeae-maydis SCOH1-5 TaxID=717836 RepID=A0A6A6FU84_9PEZI|nr:hypothetical protein CERZMDRAFT_32855 [Cercospora zeae-maydis SCOH1-5]